VVRSLLKETVQVSAVEGEVDKIYAHTGELVGNGSPIMTVNLLDDVWGKFNIREDHLEGIRQGSIITAYSPAFKKEYRLKVYYMKGEDEYATWKSTKADKDYDLKTFEIRARPVERNKELRPGMLLIKK
jgi:HlyD family secretion protein